MQVSVRSPRNNEVLFVENSFFRRLIMWANGALPAIFVSQTLRTFFRNLFLRLENWQCIGAMVD